MTTINKDTVYHYKIGNVEHQITVQKGSSLLLDELGEPIINQAHMKKMNKLFKSWIKFADKHRVKWVCQGGTLLGAARESKGHLFWDDDIDVNVLYSEYDKLFDLCGDHGKYKLEKADTGFNYHPISGGYPFLDVFVLEKQNDDKYVFAGPFINKKPQFCLNTFWPKEYMYKSEIDNRIKVPFEDYEAYVPANYIEVVKRQFCPDILTSYYYDTTKEVHSISINNKLCNALLSHRQRCAYADILFNMCDYNTSKYIYNCMVVQSVFRGEENKYKLVVDEYAKSINISNQKFLRKQLLVSAKSSLYLIDYVIRSV